MQAAQAELRRQRCRDSYEVTARAMTARHCLVMSGPSGVAVAGASDTRATKAMPSQAVKAVQVVQVS